MDENREVVVGCEVVGAFVLLFDRLGDLYYAEYFGGGEDWGFDRGFKLLKTARATG